jgi:hypothetical protein
VNIHSYGTGKAVLQRLEAERRILDSDVISQPDLSPRRCDEAGLGAKGDKPCCPQVKTMHMVRDDRRLVGRGVLEEFTIFHFTSEEESASSSQ